MNMVSMQISIPQDMAAVIENASEEMTFERNALWLYPYIRSMKISHGRAAAEILGVPKLDLIEFYNSIGLCIWIRLKRNWMRN